MRYICSMCGTEPGGLCIPSANYKRVAYRISRDVLLILEEYEDWDKRYCEERDEEVWVSIPCYTIIIVKTEEDPNEKDLEYLGLFLENKEVILEHTWHGR